MNKVDVSVVMGVHKEFLYILTALESVGKAVLQAQRKHIATEVILVLDRSDELTISRVMEWVDTQLFGVEAIRADNGNAGATRNQGIAAARGKYVWTADSDDLVSENSLCKLYEDAEAWNDFSTIFMLEYLICFGDSNYVTKYVHSDILLSSDFASLHPYTSRIFARRELLLEHPYGDYGPGKPFTFEDWDLVLRLRLAGCNFRVAENTALYYRVRAQSVSARVSSGSSDILPPSKFFSRQTYLSNLERELNELSNNKLLSTRREAFTVSDPLKEFTLSDQLMLDFVGQASIEPELSLINLRHASSGIWLSQTPVGLGSRLATLLIETEGKTFSDIVVLPNFGRGGSQKYIADVLSSLQSIEMARNVLWIQVELSRSTWEEMVPANSTFINLADHTSVGNLEEQIQTLSRFLLTPEFHGARIHFLTCLLTYELLRKNSHPLSAKNSLILYRFVDDIIETGSAYLRDSTATKYLRSFGQNLSLILSDSHFIRTVDARTLGFTKDIHKFAPTPIDVPAKYTPSDSVSYKVLWASRLAAQKRPHLLPLLQKELRKRGISVEFFLYGTEEDGLSRDLFRGTPGIQFLGPFSDFNEIPLNDFDFMLYTSNIDGRAIVVLEALSAGMPVIGIAAGGMAEIFKNFAEDLLVLNEMADSVTVNALAQKIERFYARPGEFLQAARSISGILAKEHSRRANQEVVAKVMPPVPQDLLYTDPFEVETFASLAIELIPSLSNSPLHNRPSATRMPLGQRIFYKLEAYGVKHKNSLHVRVLLRLFTGLYRSLSKRFLSK
jgi:glycosyltransferase involved in cell wall biosynthesis